MNHIKQICKDPVKVEQKLQGKQFLLGKYFNLKSDCKKCKKDKKFPSSKRQKLLQIQHQLNQQELKVKSMKQPIPQKTSIKTDQNQHLTFNLSSIKMIDEQQQNAQKTTQIQTPLSYQYFLPLHRLWKAYIQDLIAFEVDSGQKHYLINGNTLVYRPSDRSKHKFKFRMGEPLNFDFLGQFIIENQQ